MVKVTTKPTRSGTGFVVQVDGQSAAWISGNGGFTIGRKYRAGLGDKPVPEQVQAAIEKARAKVRRAGKETS